MSPSHTILLFTPLAPIQPPTNTLPCCLLPRSALGASRERRGLWGLHLPPLHITTGPQVSQGFRSVSQCLGRWPLGELSHLQCLPGPYTPPSGGLPTESWLWCAELLAPGLSCLSIAFPSPGLLLWPYDTEETALGGFLFCL